MVNLNRRLCLARPTPPLAVSRLSPLGRARSLSAVSENGFVALCDAFYPPLLFSTSLDTHSCMVRHPTPYDEQLGSTSACFPSLALHSQRTQGPCTTPADGIPHPSTSSSVGQTAHCRVHISSPILFSAVRYPSARPEATLADIPDIPRRRICDFGCCTMEKRSCPDGCRSAIRAG